MPRIRSIKPEFVQSETIGKLSRDARLLFIQLWTIVDDEGRARAASRMLASVLYPYDDDAPDLIEGWLTELEAKGCIRRYQIDGCQYLDIPNWLKHQKIDHASKSRLPEFRETSREVATNSEVLAPDLGPRNGPRTFDQESSLRSESSGRRPLGYSQAFENEFWKPYPRTPIMSKKQAWIAWGRISEDDRAAAIAALPAFKAFLAANKDHPAVHGCRFLSERRFDGFFAPEPTPQSNGGWRPGLPTDSELREKYASSEIGQNTSMVVDRDDARANEPELVRGQDRKRGAQSLGKVLRSTRMGAHVLSEAVQQRTNAAMPVAGVDASGHPTNKFSHLTEGLD